MSLMKERSILTQSIGNRFKYASEEYPVPKSSIEGDPHGLQLVAASGRTLGVVPSPGFR